MNKKRQFLLTILFAVSFGIALAKDYSLTSPNGKLIVTISNGVNISVSHQGNEVISVKADLNDDCSKVLGVHTTKTRNEHIVSPFYRQQEFTTAYRQADVALSNGFGMEMRVYNEGVAYRFLTTHKGETVFLKWGCYTS